MIAVLALLLVPAVMPGEAVSIPAATFQQGGRQAPDEQARRQVTLSAYRIDRHEVTVGAYQRFVEEGWSEDRWWSADALAWRDAHDPRAAEPLRRSDRGDDHPVVAVSWYEAQAYCRWQGGRLPTESEWEHAACRDSEARFAWGDDEPATGPAWFTSGKLGAVKSVATQPVEQQDQSLASPHGLLHTAGNVWEWTADSYRASAFEGGPASDPLDSSPGPWKVLRGGSYMNLPSYCTCTHREPARPEQLRLSVGFRCAYDE